MGTVSRSASASSPRPARAVVIAALLVVAALAAAPAHADLQKLGGMLSIGGAKLFVSDRDSLSNGGTPSGSISFAAGVDYPVASQWRVGAEIGFHLLGTRNVESGSFSASVDYSTFETSLLAHWLPQGLGPLRRISIGPSLLSARADVSAGAGGASFSKLAVEQVAPGIAASATLMPGGNALVRAGLEIGARTAFLDGGKRWTVGLLRLAIHF